MWYILYMNKDTIYIEPDDDITDIITKIENSKERIVALVPPKKAGVFRSVVNIKLITKAGVSAKKNIVLVTTDPSIVKLAGAAKIPVTKDLQTPPTVPDADEEVVTSKEELVEESDGTVETKEDVEELEPAAEEKSEAEEEDSEDAEEGEETEEAEEEEKPEDKKSDKKDKKADAKSKKAEKEKKKSGKDSFFKKHLKGIIIGSVIGVLAIVFLVWALVIAPAATVTVGIRTTSANFSENVTFTEKLDEENAKEGKFYLEEVKKDFSNTVEFEATGEKNVGEKAKGEVNVYVYFPLNIKASVQIKEDEAFMISDLVFRATKTVTLSYEGNGKEDCANKDNSDGLVNYGCRVNATVPVVASEPGSKYNIAASSTGWKTNALVIPYSDSAMAGGTDDVIKIVLQSDIDKKLEEVKNSNTSDRKAALLEEIKEDKLPIDASYSVSTADPVATPKVGEEVKEGTKPTIKVTTTAKIYVLDETKVEEFVTEKAKIEENQRIYEMKTPFIENFIKGENGYTGKLKTSYAYGPKITESDVVDLIKGRGLGDAQHLLRDINGVASVKIDPSYPWVNSIPNDTNKITVILDVDGGSQN